MGGFAGLDGAFDRGERWRRKRLADPRAVGDEMSADALDAHVPHQLPDAPPPPKLPPPPLNPPLELLPPEKPPPLLIHPPLPAPPDEVIASLNRVTKNAITPPIADSASDAAMNQNSAATAPPVASEPNSLPNIPRRIPPPKITATIKNGLNGSISLRLPKFCCRCTGCGSGSPSTTRRMRLTPSDIPPAKSPLRNFGVITSSMMRLAVTSVSAPSRP